MRRTLVLALAVALGVALGLAACGHAQAPRAPAGVGRHVAIYMPGPDDAPATGGFTGVLRALERPADGDGDGVDGDDLVGELVDGDGGLGLSGAPPPPPWPGEAPTPETRGLAVVDDRRWLEVPADGRVTIDGVAATLALDSVVVEPLDGAALAVSWCDRPPAPAGAPAGAGAALRCQLRGVAGRHLVRIAYTASGASWQASHRVTAHLDAAGRGTAAIQSTFAIAAPGWPADAAEVELWRGLPDGPARPVRVWSGRTPLAATVSVPGTASPGEVRARTIAIYRGAAIATARPPTDPAWNEDSRADVQDWLLLDAPLPGGQAEVEVVGQAGSQIALGQVEPGSPELWGPGLVCPPRPGAAPAPDCATTTGPIGARVPLWPDARWRGRRVVHRISAADDALREGVRLTVENLGDAPAEVWIEEPLRTARRHQVEALGRTAHDRGGWLRAWFRVEPKRRVQTGYALSYDF